MSNSLSPSSASSAALEQLHSRRRPLNRLQNQDAHEQHLDYLVPPQDLHNPPQKDLTAQQRTGPLLPSHLRYQQQQQQHRQGIDEQDLPREHRRLVQHPHQQPLYADPAITPTSLSVEGLSIPLWSPEPSPGAGHRYPLPPSSSPPPLFPTLDPQPTFPSPGSDEDDDVTWLVLVILSIALIIPFASVIRSCGQKAGWLTGSPSPSPSTSSPAGRFGTGSGGTRANGVRGRGFGGGYAGTGPHPVPEWEIDPAETEERLSALSDSERQAFDAAKAFQIVNPPNSVPTDISLSQYLSIQEKGVSAWEFEASYDQQLFVHDRTELSFFDRVASVQTNLPLPKQQEVYYWEVKMFEKSPNTTIAVGVSTKPYPSTRLPGWNRHSVGYFSNNGQKHCNSLWNNHPYGPPYFEGDVIGCGYRPRNGTIFFTRNGKRIEDAYTGFGRTNLFPTVGATGPCVLHVNFGQSGFVFVEANVKKWGLAPASGSLAPPPAYGSELGSILLEASSGSATTNLPGSLLTARARPILQSSGSQSRLSQTASHADGGQQQQLLLQQQQGEANIDSRVVRNGARNGEHGSSATLPLQITSPNMSVPPPIYSSLDRHGNTERDYGVEAMQARGHLGNSRDHETVDIEDDDDDATSTASDDSEESVTLLLTHAQPHPYGSERDVV
ncbi:Rsp5p-dependent ubiquitination, sorting of cargo proteins at the multivesicular body [Mortierella antarctica]|nr:Rsp5p-dependent ubiquitination, sorting of cargo proteins at the multivesicular body [Mortierella antarctica]